MNEINSIEDEFLFLCGASGVTRDNIFKRGITCIINCSNEIANLELQEVEFINVNVADSPNSLIGEHFDSCGDKIEEHRQNGGKVLVHCMAGISRSSSVILAYLVRHRQMSLREAYFHVKEKRYIRPNDGFWKQLIEYEKQIHKTVSVKMVNTTYNGRIPDVIADELEPNWKINVEQDNLI